MTVFEKSRVKKQMIYPDTIIAIFAATLCVSFYGCLTIPEKSIPALEIFWPKPPEVRRIQFVNNVSTPRDLNIESGYFKQFVNYMVGVSIPSIIGPYGISSDPKGRLYVVDTVLKRVHVFDATQNHYHYFPTDREMFGLPIGIAIDQNHRIYVTDARQGVVDIFKDQGQTFVSSLGQGVFKRPTGIAVNQKTSELLVVDTQQSQVFRYDLESQKPKGWFGGNGKNDGQFHFPTNIFVTLSGQIIVSDSLNFRVQVFSPQGVFLYRLGQMGHEPGTFSRPKGVACDSDGNIYVVDALFDNIQLFDAEGRLLMAFGDHGAKDGQFWLPTGIYIDQNDFIYVSDTSNQRVCMFKYLKYGVMQ